MSTKNKEKRLKAIFFDAVGTLFYLSKTVGDHYALVAKEVGLTFDAQQLDPETTDAVTNDVHREKTATGYDLLAVEPQDKTDEREVL